MKAKDLFTLAPLGATVRFTDSTPRPPDRHKNKLSQWKSRNGSGVFAGARSDPERPYFTLRLVSTPSITVNSIRSIDNDAFDYEIEQMPVPGSVLAYYSAYANEKEVQYVWPSLAEAEAWAARGHYRLSNCGYRYWMVQYDGSLDDYVPEGDR